MGLLPKQEKFYRLFAGQADYIQRAAGMLLDGARNGNSELARIASEIESIENAGDAVIHEILEKLNRTFITPLDPEDIHRLAGALDDMLDAIEETAHRLAAHGLEPIPAEIIRLCEIVKSSSDQIVKAVESVEHDDSALPFCIEINRLENEADSIYRENSAKLFRTEQNPIALLRQKEVLDSLEETMDRAEDVADVIQNVAVKNA